MLATRMQWPSTDESGARDRARLCCPLAREGARSHQQLQQRVPDHLPTPMDLLSGYASSDDDGHCAAEHVQPQPAPRTALPDAASLFAPTTTLPAGQLGGRCDLVVPSRAGVAVWLTQPAFRQSCGLSATGNRRARPKACSRRRVVTPGAAERCAHLVHDVKARRTDASCARPTRNGSSCAREACQ